MFKRNQKLIIIAIIAVSLVIGVVLWRRDRASALANGSSPQSSEARAQAEAKHFDKKRHSLTDPASIWVVVNKKNALPSSYVPATLRVPQMRLRNGTVEMQLRDDAADAVESLNSLAAAEGINLLLVSGYRSFNTQQAVYNNFVRQDGQAQADRYSARPGHSEHQTGLAVDLGTADGVCQLEECFGTTKAGQWLAAHAHEFGFIIRYPEGKESIVGYQYEPWHLRYVGVDLATELYSTGQTMEEFFGLPPASNY